MVGAAACDADGPSPPRAASSARRAVAPPSAADPAPAVDLAAIGPGAALELLPWPDDAAGATARDGRPIHVLLDAGHGAPSNEGNTSSFGVLEQDFTLDLALDVAADLEAMGFEVTASRGPGESTPYAMRLERARAANADVFVSLHSDVRGTITEWSPVPGTALRASSDAPGFSVLHADEGPAALAAARHGLAVAVSSELRAAGFHPYGGAEYVGLYAPDASEPGVFVDRHADAKRIFVLRRTPMPAIIVETHNALDPREAARWDEGHTREVFGRALGRGIAAALAPVTAPIARDAGAPSRPDVR